MNNLEKQEKISEILVVLLNNNLGNRISVELAQGILNIFARQLKQLLEENKEENYNK